MNILVSGGAGFIGSHLVKKLSESHVVTVIDRKTGFNILTDDLYTLFEYGKFNVVFHLAANSDISTGDPAIEYADTFKTTMALLGVCRQYKVMEFIFASSSAVYGDSFYSLNETSPYKPISHYGAAKMASEAFIYSYARRFNIKSWICRFPNVVGSNATHGVIFDLLRKNKLNPERLEVLGNGHQLKPYIHVSELIDAILYVWTSSRAWVNDYNIAPKGFTTVREIAEMITDNEIVYTGESWPGDCQKYEFDTHKLSRLGWNPRMTSTEAVKLAIDELKKEL